MEGNDADVRRRWASLPHRERFRACRLAVRGRRHPTPEVHEAALGWALVVRAYRPSPWKRATNVALNLVDFVTAPTTAEDVLDGAPEHDHNWAVRWYSRCLVRLERG